MKGGNRSIELGRRQFLRGGATATAAAVVAGAVPRSADATPALCLLSQRRRSAWRIDT